MSKGLKISPTPWSVSELGAVIDANDRVICPTPCIRDDEIVRGNAALMAAAPNMLSMMRRVRAYITDGKVVAELNELLAEVQGEA